MSNVFVMEHQLDARNPHYTPIEQQINLTLHAWDTIQYDITAFQNRPVKIQVGNFINRIIENYAHEARCSIAEHKIKYLNEIKNHFNTEDADTEEEYLKYLTISFLPIGDDVVFKKYKLSPNQKVKELLCYSDNDLYYKTRKDYLEAIINEYVSLPFAEREKIYFKDMITKINDSVNECRSLRVKYFDCQYEVCPCFIENDKSTNYNYLVCIDADNSSLLSFRLQHISVTATNNTFQKFTQARLNEIKKIIDKYGVPYIRGYMDGKIRLRLTAQGMANFKAWINQRPKYSGNLPLPEEDGSYILEFECSKRQIWNYFFKFGADVEIIEPNDLKERFISGYRNALNVYEQTSAQN